MSLLEKIDKSSVPAILPLLWMETGDGQKLMDWSVEGHKDVWFPLEKW